MRLLYRIVIRLGLALIVIMALWATLFYFAMADEIRDEVDDSLEDYSALIITRVLASRPLPQVGDGSNNTFSITPVDALYAAEHPHLEYKDVDVYIAEKRETEPARMMTSIFSDSEGKYYKLEVATPSFEKDDLFEAVLWWIVVLYVILLVVTLGVTLLIFQGNMRPLYALLRWLDDYRPGSKPKSVPIDYRIQEFGRLGQALQGAVDRSEELVERQSQFIGNASHELQTPLAIIGNRVEWLLDGDGVSDEQAAELYKIQKTLSRAVRLNKTLLLLTKIENGQFPESGYVDVGAIAQEAVESYGEIYASQEIEFSVELGEGLKVEMNESLATTLVSNLIKNIYVHSEPQAKASVIVRGRSLIVENDGSQELDGQRLFDRFYQANTKRSGSTGLGLALVAAVCNHYSFGLSYRFVEGRHRFVVEF